MRVSGDYSQIFSELCVWFTSVVLCECQHNKSIRCYGENSVVLNKFHSFFDLLAADPQQCGLRQRLIEHGVLTVSV